MAGAIDRNLVADGVEGVEYGPAIATEAGGDLVEHQRFEILVALALPEFVRKGN